MDKDQVAEVFENVAMLLDLKGENPFKTRAYSNAARALSTLAEPLQKIVAEKRLPSIKGIGTSLQEKIEELVSTGKLAYYEELKAATPAGLVAMLDIPGLGPKKIKVLYDDLKISTIEDLETACKDGRVAALKGFGEKTAVNICEGITRRRAYASRHLLADALLVSEPLLEALREHPGVIRCSTAGSLRRHCEIVGDIDLLASSKKPASVIQFFVEQPGILKVLAKGDTKASVVLEGGIQADLRVVSDAEFAPALMYFTGNKQHNIVMRQRAIARGLRLNEYGLFRSEVETRDPKLLVPCSTEESIFQELGLAFVPPEMREDTGEFALAEKNEMPRLIEWSELKGSLHNHSTWSDGRQTTRDIAKSMQELGLSYWAITDHSKSSVQANGLDAKRLLKELEEIRGLNAELEKQGVEFRLLTGIEVDILRDGQLDLPDEVLAQLDVVVASLHQSFNQPEAEITKRAIRAVENPNVHIMGHLTGRLLLEREPNQVNQHAVIDACAATGTWIELNASPYRFDMDWRLWPYAKSKGVKCVINCDAHRLEQAGFLRLGAGMARKAGLTKRDVVNTMGYTELMQALRAKKRRG